jgi:hypothetical protein
VCYLVAGLTPGFQPLPVSGSGPAVATTATGAQDAGGAAGRQPGASAPGPVAAVVAVAAGARSASPSRLRGGGPASTAAATSAAAMLQPARYCLPGVDSLATPRTAPSVLAVLRLEVLEYAIAGAGNLMPFPTGEPPSPSPAVLHGTARHGTALRNAMTISASRTAVLLYYAVPYCTR